MRNDDGLKAALRKLDRAHGAIYQLADALDRQHKEERERKSKERLTLLAMECTEKIRGKSQEGVTKTIADYMLKAFDLPLE